MKYATIALAILITLTANSIAFADSSRDEVKVAIESLIGSELPDAAVVESATDGVYVIDINGTIYHALLKDSVLLIGEAFDLARGVSLNEEINNRGVSAAVSDLSSENMIIFAAHDKKRHVTVFTDIDCSYCRRFHQEVPALNDAGLEVRYVAYPRAGIGSSSYDKIVTVWCSDNPQQAMTRSKSGEVLPTLSCTNPVADHYQAGVDGGVRGTPTLVLDDGSVIGGYLPANDLLIRIGLKGS